MKLLSLSLSRKVLISISVLFIFNGVLITSLNLMQVIPVAYYWQGPSFLILGIIAFSISYLTLSAKPMLSIIILFLLFIPWTVFGLLNDFRVGLWLLVFGEIIGLVLVLWSLISIWRKS